MNTLATLESHPLQPFLPKQAKLLMLGSFPPPQTRWKMNFFYPNYQNDMWRIFGLIFFQDKNHFLDLNKKEFQEQKIRDFLTRTGIAIFDTATQVRRLKGNAADKFLDIVTATDISQLLAKIPNCHSIMTTGDKATDTLMLSMPKDAVKPSIGQPSVIVLDSRAITLYRMPSSSRAYPLALDKKAEYYRALFTAVGFV